MKEQETLHPQNKTHRSGVFSSRLRGLFSEPTEVNKFTRLHFIFFPRFQYTYKNSFFALKIVDLMQKHYSAATVVHINFVN